MVDYRDIESKAKELSSIKNLDYYELREKELDKLNKGISQIPWSLLWFMAEEE